MALIHLTVLRFTAVGFPLGLLVVVICRPPPQFNREVAYVSFASWVAVILVYTLVCHLMKPPLDFYEIVKEGVGNEEEREIEEPQASNDISKPLLVEAECPDIHDKEIVHCRTLFIANVFNSISSHSQTNFPDLEHSDEATATATTTSPRLCRCLAEPRVVRRIQIVAEQTPIQHILQPSTVVSLLAIVIGMVSQLKTYVFGYDASLSFITDSLEILAGVMVPSMMLIMGGMLAEVPRESTLGLRTTVGITVARFLVLPLVGIGVCCIQTPNHIEDGT